MRVGASSFEGEQILGIVQYPHIRLTLTASINFPFYTVWSF